MPEPSDDQLNQAAREMFDLLKSCYVELPGFGTAVGKEPGADTKVKVANLLIRLGHKVAVPRRPGPVRHGDAE
jgi:hypothetical protein